MVISSYGQPFNAKKEEGNSVKILFKKKNSEMSLSAQSCKTKKKRHFLLLPPAY